MFNPTAYEDSGLEGIGVLEVIATAPTPEVGPAEPSAVPLTRLFVPLRLTALSGDLAGPIASLRLIQVFGFSQRQSSAVFEVAYRFPFRWRHDRATRQGARDRPSRRRSPAVEHPPPVR